MEGTTSIYHRIFDDLKSDSIPTGWPVGEAEFARIYGVSPTPVPDSGRILERQGLVKWERNGNRVVQPQQYGEEFGDSPTPALFDPTTESDQRRNKER